MWYHQTTQSNNIQVWTGVTFLQRYSTQQLKKKTKKTHNSSKAQVPYDHYLIISGSWTKETKVLLYFLLPRKTEVHEDKVKVNATNKQIRLTHLPQSAKFFFAVSTWFNFGLTAAFSQKAEKIAPEWPPKKMVVLLSGDWEFKSWHCHTRWSCTLGCRDGIVYLPCQSERH